MQRDEEAVTTNQAETAAAANDGGTETTDDKAGEKRRKKTTARMKKKKKHVAVDTRTIMRPFPVLTEEQLAWFQDPVERESWRELMARGAKLYYESCSRD